MRVLDWSSLSVVDRYSIIARPAARVDMALVETVRDIVANVAERNWDAVCRYAQDIDGSVPKAVCVADIIAAARAEIGAEAIAAMDMARDNIARFHDACVPADIDVEVRPGLRVRKVWRAIDAVGLYVPGGKTPLFSTLMMLAIPAKTAGVGAITVCTPPRPDGTLDPALAVAADLCGIETIWTLGGPQAIAAMAFGSGPIPKCAKICGPGNAYVAEAKARVAAMPDGATIDMPAGPSELMVIADDSADARTVAADLLGQAEHDPSAQVILVSTDAALANAVAKLLPEMVDDLPRHDIASASLANARLLVTRTLESAVEIANDYAPEHLSLAVTDPDALVPLVRNAGAVFAGRLAAETFGDYIAGSSHVLPTDGAAKAYGGITVHSFMKPMTVQSLSPDAVRDLAGPAAVLARLEGLEAHARAADIRLETAS